jgi:hypothetical protein
MSTRLKDKNWTPGDEKGNAPDWERVAVAILLDIRDRLDVLRCPSFVDIPFKLDRIGRELIALRRECRQRVRQKRGKRP